MADTTEQPRDGNNKFLYDNAAVQRDAEAARLKSDGLTYQEIADALGYSDRGNAWRGVQRAKRAILREPAEELIQVESGRLDELYVEALAVLERDHVMVANGKIVCDEDGSPLRDDGPKLAALRELRQIRESYRKLHGLDSPAKVNMEGELKYEVVGIAPEDLA
ncbi:hypothetical protein OHA04_45685 (plasmid) [Streptomyces sp. NBC_01590]|uniref:hypothetical protein n=1 Tax=Streptomyces sp. NBC_01590 TaxID=2975887 RepID=UPI002F918406